MKFTEFKAKVMTQLGLGEDVAQIEMINKHLPKLTPPHQVALMAPLLHAGKVGIIKQEEAFLLAPLEKSGREETLLPFLDFLENKEIQEKDVEAIFKSAWGQSFTVSESSGKIEWIIAYYLLRKRYVGLMLSAIKEGKAFSLWREIPIVDQVSIEKAIPLKEVLLKILAVWPTSGKSGFYYIQELRGMERLKELLKDPEVMAAVNHAEGMCDFGVLPSFKS